MTVYVELELTAYLLSVDDCRHVIISFIEQCQYSLVNIVVYMAKTEHSHPLGMVVSTHFRCGKGVKRGLKNGALPFNID